jgi:hypothetical protein
MNITTKEAQPTNEQMKLYMQEWVEWINYIAGKGKLATRQSFFQNGKSIKDEQLNYREPGYFR